MLRAGNSGARPLRCRYPRDESSLIESLEISARLLLRLFLHLHPQVHRMGELSEGMKTEMKKKTKCLNFFTRSCFLGGKGLQLRRGSRFAFHIHVGRGSMVKLSSRVAVFGCPPIRHVSLRPRYARWAHGFG